MQSYSRVREKQQNMEVKIYTDGSCNTQLKTGGWASIIVYDDQKIILKGIEKDVTHQQMELLAVINSVVYLENKNLIEYDVVVYSDSQYVVDIVGRRQKLKQVNFMTRAGVEIRNSKFVQQLIQYMDQYRLQFIKLKSHTKGTFHENMNREVDMLIRKELRNAIEGEKTLK